MGEQMRDTVIYNRVGCLESTLVLLRHWAERIAAVSTRILESEIAYEAASDHHTEVVVPQATEALRRRRDEVLAEAEGAESIDYEAVDAAEAEAKAAWAAAKAAWAAAVEPSRQLVRDARQAHLVAHADLVAALQDLPRIWDQD